jgi:hypothetical protein
MQLTIGTKEEEVVRFLEETGLHASINSELTSPRMMGTAMDIGCPRIFGRGNDAMIAVEVGIAGDGTAIVAPSVNVMYTNCMGRGCLASFSSAAGELFLENYSQILTGFSLTASRVRVSTVMSSFWPNWMAASEASAAVGLALNRSVMRRKP